MKRDCDLTSFPAIYMVTIFVLKFSIQINILGTQKLLRISIPKKEQIYLRKYKKKDSEDLSRNLKKYF